MKQYLDLLREIREKGKLKDQRATLQDGSKPKILSVFGRQIRFDLQDGFPMVTTKKMPWKPIVAELQWFLRGDTNVKFLQQQGVKIWDAWADANGDLGPVYGKHWRNWEGPQGRVDQIALLLSNIKKVKLNPHTSEARRLVVTAWNPADMPHSSVPTGCHTFFQMNVTDGALSCQLYQR